MPSFASGGWRSAVILLLYGYQGLVAGFATTALPNWQAASGASLGEIGAYLATIGLPWTLQPLWGPVVDRFTGARTGRRRFWVLFGIAGALACLLLLAAGGEWPLHRLALVLLVHNIFASLIDTALDGLIIDRVPTARLGQATALTRVGFAGGTAAGAAFFAWAIPEFGPGSAGWILLLFGLLAAVAPVAVREAAEDDLLSLRWRREPGRDASVPAMLGSLLAEILRRDTLAIIAFCFLVEFVIGAFGVRLSVGLVQEGGWEAAEVSRLQGGLTFLGGTAGALGVAFWVDRTGPFHALVTLLMLCAACHLGAGLLLWPAAPGAAAHAAALSLSALSPALFFVALAPAVMLDSRGSAAATRFALFMAALNLGTISGAAAAAQIGSVMDTPAMGLAAGAVLAACTLAAGRGMFPGIQRPS